jgi:hypothetical protein
VALDNAMKTEVAIDGRSHAVIEGKPTGTSWQELSVALPDGLDELELTLTPLENATTTYHLWIVSR